MNKGEKKGDSVLWGGTYSIQNIPGHNRKEKHTRLKKPCSRERPSGKPTELPKDRPLHLVLQWTKILGSYSMISEPKASITSVNLLQVQILDPTHTTSETPGLKTSGLCFTNVQLILMHICSYKTIKLKPKILGNADTSLVSTSEFLWPKCWNY